MILSCPAGCQLIDDRSEVFNRARLTAFQKNDREEIDINGSQQHNMVRLSYHVDKTISQNRST